MKGSSLCALLLLSNAVAQEDASNVTEATNKSMALKLPAKAGEIASLDIRFEPEPVSLEKGVHHYPSFSLGEILPRCDHNASDIRCTKPGRLQDMTKRAAEAKAQADWRDFPGAKASPDHPLSAFEGMDKDEVAKLDQAAKEGLKSIAAAEELAMDTVYKLDKYDQMEWNISAAKRIESKAAMDEAEAAVAQQKAEQDAWDEENSPLRANLTIGKSHSNHLRNLVRAERQPTFHFGKPIGTPASWVPPPSAKSKVPDYINAAMEAERLRKEGAAAAIAAVKAKVSTGVQLGPEIGQ